MKEDKTMLELRKIKREISKEFTTMTFDERKKKNKEITDKVLKEMENMKSEYPNFTGESYMVCEPDNSEEDSAMKEVRGIRDANSKRHLKMTLAEMKKEEKETTEWFDKEMKELKESKDKD